MSWGLTLKVGNHDIVWVETGEPILTNYDINELSVLYYEMKKVLGDKITMAYSTLEKDEI